MNSTSCAIFEQMLTCPARCHVQAMPAPPIEEQNCILALIFLLVLSLVLVVSIIDFVRQFLCTGMRVRDVEMRMKTANHQGKVNLYGAWIRARGNINVSFDQGNKLIVLRVNEGVVQVCGGLKTGGLDSIKWPNKHNQYDSI